MPGGVRLSKEGIIRPQSVAGSIGQTQQERGPGHRHGEQRHDGQGAEILAPSTPLGHGCPCGRSGLLLLGSGEPAPPSRRRSVMWSRLRSSSHQAT